MNISALKKYLLFFLAIVLVVLFLPTLINNHVLNPKTVYAASPIQHVFIIMEENHNWSAIKGSAQAPYINKTLLPMGGHAEQYFNPPGMHPSEPNYLWLEAGTNFGVLNDSGPSTNNFSSTAHLVTLLKNAGKSWKAYQEDIPGTNCPINNTGNYAVRHAPFVFFNDVSGKPPSTSNTFCQSHYIPFTSLASDLTNNTVANYNFITPNLQDDMHDGSIQQADTWLSQHVPTILNSQAYKNNGLLIITWDEGEGGDGPIGMIILSPLAKKNYTNTIHYTHSSTLRTMEEIFSVSPMLGGAASATDLSDFFTTSIVGTGGGITPPVPTNITPTLFCLGGTCPGTTTPKPTAKVTTKPTISNSPITLIPTKKPCSNGVQIASVHAFKAHKHKNGAISNLLLLFLQFIIKLLEQLFGISIPPIGNPAPSPSPVPSTNPSVAPSVNPTANPCPSQAVSGTQVSTVPPISNGSTNPSTTLSTSGNTIPTAITCTGNGSGGSLNYTGWTLVNCEDFNGTSLPSGWKAYNGGGGGTVVGVGRTPGQCTVGNGIVTLTQLANGATCGVSSTFSQKYGRWEARMRAYTLGGSGSAPHPVLILWPSTVNSPQGGEYDYAETSIGSPMEAFMHCATSAGGNCVTASNNVDYSQWHNYAIEWTATHVSGFIDGKQWFNGTASNVQAPGPMHQTIQLDNLTGKTPVKPGKMEVDWVHVYKQ